MIVYGKMNNFNKIIKITNKFVYMKHVTRLISAPLITDLIFARFWCFFGQLKKRVTDPPTDCRTDGWTDTLFIVES